MVDLVRSPGVDEPPRSEDSRLTKGARTRLRILDAGARVLRTRGYAQTRLSDIAEVAGLQTGSLSFHFPAKSDLLEEVLRHGFEMGLRQVREAVDGLGPAASPADRVSAAVRAHLTALEESPDYAPALLRTMDQFPADIRHRLGTLDQDYVGYWRQLLEASRAVGSPNFGVDGAVLARLVLGALNANLGHPGMAPRRRLVDAVLMMLHLPGPDPRGSGDPTDAPSADPPSGGGDAGGGDAGRR